jgi:hypothetical protein
MGPRVLIISRVQLEIYLELISREHYSHEAHDEVLNFCCIHLLRAVLDQYGPIETRRALGLCWALLLLTWPGKVLLDSISC